MSAKEGRHARIFQILRSRIARGDYKGKLPSRRTLALELRTNIQTVCVALARLETLGLVRSAERQGTFVASREGHRQEAPITYARLILDNPLDAQGNADPWAAVIVYGFQLAAHEHEVSMVLLYSSDKGLAVEETVRESRASGCLGTCLIGMDFSAADALRLAEAEGAVLAVESALAEPLVPNLIPDHVEEGRMAAEHLVKLGHRKIAFAIREAAVESHRDRLRGTERYLSDIGMRLCGVVTYQKGRFFDVEELFKPSDLPTAIIIGGSRMAAFLTGVAVGRGLRVPQDLSVVTFDDCRSLHLPAVTLIATDHLALGRKAFEMLLDDDLCAHPRRVVLPTKLVDHGTTAPPGDAHSRDPLTSERREP